MSYVTNVLLSFSILEDEDARMAEVNGWLSQNDSRGQQLGDISGAEDPKYGGSKFMEVPLWGAAFNYVDLDGLRGAVRAAKWKEPEHVRLFVCDQDDDTFRMETLT